MDKEVPTNSSINKFSYMLRKVISFTPRKNHFLLLQGNPIKNLNPNRNLRQLPTTFIFSIFVKYEMKGKNTTLQHNVIDNISLSFIKHACMQLVPKSEDPSIKQTNIISFQTKFQGSPQKHPINGRGSLPIESSNILSFLSR
jgi:hypothetical protein